MDIYWHIPYIPCTDPLVHSCNRKCRRKARHLACKCRCNDLRRLGYISPHRVVYNIYRRRIHRTFSAYIYHHRMGSTMRRLISTLQISGIWNEEN